MSLTPAHEIMIEIGPGGTVKSTVVGLTGPACTAASAWVDSLGTVTRDEHTEDYDREAGQGTTTKQGSKQKQGL